LCPTFFEQEDLLKFKNISFEDGFYEVLIETVRIEHPDLLKRYPSLGDRDKVKKMVLSFLTDTEKKHRKNMAIVLLMERLFPTICEFVQSNLVYRNFKSPMPYLLQRSESFLVLDLVAKELINSFPNSKFITIHDCFLMENGLNDNDKVVEKIKQVLFDFTGVIPGVTVKTLCPITDAENIVDKTFLKLKSRSFIKEKINTPDEKRLFSSAIIFQVERGICHLYYGEERTKALDEFKSFIDKRYGA
jgi:hypothetical protein